MKHIYKVLSLILLFLTTGTDTIAGVSLFDNKDKAIVNSPVNADENTTIRMDMTALYALNDTLDTLRSPELKPLIGTDLVTVPAELKMAPIHFQVNSYINYLNINHFIGNESKDLFIQGWLKEKELRQMSLNTDSLRKAYSVASAEDREKISGQILTAEQKSIALNEAITGDFQRARELEDHYWQSASMDEITQFQKKINSYEDSINRISQLSSPAEVQDTITIYLPATKQKPEEKKAEVPAGIIYKIQIGAFKGKIPETSNKLIKKISLIRKVENSVDDKGLKVYSTGNLKTYSEAETMLGQVKQEGIKNAVITAYQNGKKILVTEARKLNNEL